jgi:hypothetical protein
MPKPKAKKVSVNADDLKKVLEYLSESEAGHFEECEPDEQANHIFAVVKRLSTELEKSTRWGASVE